VVHGTADLRSSLCDIMIHTTPAGTLDDWSPASSGNPSYHYGERRYSIRAYIWR